MFTISEPFSTSSESIEALYEGAAALLLHVPVDGGARDAPEDRNLRPCGFVDHDDQREAHGDQDAHQDAQEEGAQKGRHLSCESSGIQWPK